MADWEDQFTGAIWTLQQSVQPNGKVFERARRAPGSRILIVKDGKILISQEKRSELGGKVDNRLPGGKVFDRNDDYTAFLASGGDIVEQSCQSIIEEAKEEVGIIVDPDKLEYLGVDVLGATCSWDLHYWASEHFKEAQDGAQYHDTESEEIQSATWVSFEEARRLALDKAAFAESRSALALLRYIEQKGKK